MIITDNKNVREVQKEFNEKFPYLKIEFYQGEHHSGEGSPIKERLNPEQSIGAIRKVHTEGGIQAY